MGWNFGKEMSQNYEFFWIAFLPFEHPRTDKELIDFLDNAEFFDDGKIREKPLGSYLLKLVNSEKDPLSFILRAHLIVEHLLDAIITKKFKHADVLLNNRAFSFSMKLDVLYAKNFVDKNIYNDIRLVNVLRNKFAHNLYYDLSGFQICRFSYCEDFADKICAKSKEAKAKANLYVLKNVLFHLLLKLTQKHEYIAEIEVQEVL